MKGRLKSNAQTDRCQMRGHGAREAGVRLEDVSSVDLFFWDAGVLRDQTGTFESGLGCGHGLLRRESWITELRFSIFCGQTSV
jgi:hypothetical protein